MIKLEKVVEKFYEGLEEGKFLGRKCPVGGNVAMRPSGSSAAARVS